jgi:hypothetical protein
MNNLGNNLGGPRSRDVFAGGSRQQRAGSRRGASPVRGDSRGASRNAMASRGGAGSPLGPGWGHDNFVEGEMDIQK